MLLVSRTFCFSVSTPLTTLYGEYPTVRTAEDDGIVVVPVACSLASADRLVTATETKTTTSVHKVFVFSASIVEASQLFSSDDVTVLHPP